VAEDITMTPEVRAKIDEAKSLLTQMGSVVELRDQIQAHGGAIGEINEKLNRIDKDLEKAFSNLNKPPVVTDTPEDVKKRAFLAFGASAKAALGLSHLITERERDAVEIERRTLSVGGDSTGGLIVPPALIDEIVANITEISPVRRVADVGPTTNGSNERQILRVTTKPTTAAVAELGTRSVGTDIAFGTLHIPVYEMYAYLPVSYQMLEDTNIDLEGLVRTYVAEDFAEEEAELFVEGTGASQAEGFMSNGDVSYTAGGEASTLTNADGLIGLSVGIKQEYRRNAVWLMNRATWATVMKIKGADGQYLYHRALSESFPDRLLGYPVLECVDMPDVDTNAYPIIFGDFKKGYAIADHVAMQWMVDPQTGFTSGVTYFKARRRTGGAVKVAEAIRKLKIATS